MTALDPWPHFVQLYEAILNHRGDSLSSGILLPWLDRHKDTTAKWFAAMRGNLAPTHRFSDEESWTLYAFSRINDLLLLGFQPDPSDCPDEIWEISRETYHGFMEALGLEILSLQADFSPFHHEIVTVNQQEDPAAPALVSREFWPGVMLGSLMMSRAGVALTAGRDHVCKQVAETSTLYWTFRRRNRNVSDLSHGWGSNSQWRTSFRCDYAADGRHVFNAEAFGKPVYCPVDDDLTTPNGSSF